MFLWDFPFFRLVKAKTFRLRVLERKLGTWEIIWLCKHLLVKDSIALKRSKIAMSHWKQRVPNHKSLMTVVILRHFGLAKWRPDSLLLYVNKKIWRICKKANYTAFGIYVTTSWTNLLFKLRTLDMKTKASEQQVPADAYNCRFACRESWHFRPKCYCAWI